MTQAEPFATSGPRVTLHRERFAHYSLDGLLQDIQPEQYEIQMYGKVMPRPRLECWYHDDLTRSYGFGGGKPVTPKPWSPLLNHMRREVERVTGELFDRRSTQVLHASEIGRTRATPLSGSTRCARLQPW